MSQTVITQAFEALKAQEAANGGVLTLDEFVFASVPNLNITDPIDRTEGLPSEAQIVHRQAVSRTGMVNSNAVVYSVVLGADVGDFEFNWVGLLNKASGVVAMIVHAPSQKKIRTQSGQQGNVLTRSFLMEYNGASQQTQISTPADTWQIDFTARLNGVDERIRQENIDAYGDASFLNDGFLVSGANGSYQVKKGVAYIEGLRAELLFDQAMSVPVRPSKIWVDVCWRGTLTSVWKPAAKLTVAENLADYVEGDEQHYVYAVADILADGSVVDLRNASAIAQLMGLEEEANVFPYFDKNARLDKSALSDFSRAMLAFPDAQDYLLNLELSPPGGAGKIGGLPKPITWEGFAGGANPTGVVSSDAAFAAACVYPGDVRAEGNFRLDNPVNRVNSVIELPPGSTITKNKLAGPSTANGAKIPSKTLFGRMVIRDEDTAPIGSDSFADWPDMGQVLRLDSKQVQGQCGMFLGGDRRSPIIGGTAYVGFHSRHDQSVGTPKIWGINPVVVKNVRAVDLPAGVDSETIGMEISVANNTDERGQPQGAGMVEGLFVSYVAYTGEGSAAITTGGLTAGWRTGLWIDGVTPQGTHIQLRDENSANAGVRCGIDTTGVNHFTDAAILLGRGHSIASLDVNEGIKPLIYISSANEMVHGSNLPHRFIGPIAVFDHSIRPGTDNIYDYGSAAYRGRTAYFGTGSINTSDERHKPIQETISDALLDAWAEVSWSTMFKFDDAIAEKGTDGARWHFGLIAQHVRDVFEEHGIDGFNLGLLCYDEWEDQFEDVQTNIGETVIKTKSVTVKKSTRVIVKKPVTVRDEGGNLVQVEVDSVVEEPVGKLEYVRDSDGNFVLNPETGELLQNFVQETEELTKEYEAPAEPAYEQRLVLAAGSRYGIRYEEALSLEAALQRRNYQNLLMRTEALERKA